jgi:hypothetical protein
MQHLLNYLGSHATPNHLNYFDNRLSEQYLINMLSRTGKIHVVHAEIFSTPSSYLHYTPYLGIRIHIGNARIQKYYTGNNLKLTQEIVSKISTALTGVYMCEITIQDPRPCIKVCFDSQYVSVAQVNEIHKQIEAQLKSVGFRHRFAGGLGELSKRYDSFSEAVVSIHDLIDNMNS